MFSLQIKFLSIMSIGTYILIDNKCYIVQYETFYHSH